MLGCSFAEKDGTFCIVVQAPVSAGEGKGTNSEYKREAGDTSGEGLR